MGRSVSKNGRTGTRVRTSICARAGLLERVSLSHGLLRLFIVLLLIPLFSAVKCGSLIEGEESDPAAAGGRSGSSSTGSSSACSSAGSVTISQPTAGFAVFVLFGSVVPRIAQAFQTSANTKVQKFEIFSYAATTSPASATLDLYSGGVNPTAGTLLGSSTNNTIQLAPAAYYSWTFSDLPIATGTVYFAVLTHNDGTNGIYVEKSGSDVYFNGASWAFNNSTSSWVQDTLADGAFRITTCD